MNPVWVAPAADPVIGTDIVHIWFHDFHGATDFGSEIECLSADERARAARFSNEESQLTYLGSHLFLRRVLARYLKTEPALVRLEAGSNGKPHLIDPSPDALEFNLAHSHLASICAVTVGTKVGIDLERIDPSLCEDATAELVFSTAEMNHLASCQGESKYDAFFRGWTRKEAFAKCLGVGMSANLNRVELGFDNTIRTHQGITVSTFRCPNHYLASVAVEGKPAEITFRDLTAGTHSTGL